MPVRPRYDYLKLEPRWDLMRGDARFAETVAKLAPKDAG